MFSKPDYDKNKNELSIHSIITPMSLNDTYLLPNYKFGALLSEYYCKYQ